MLTYGAALAATETPEAPGYGWIRSAAYPQLSFSPNCCAILDLLVW